MLGDQISKMRTVALHLVFGLVESSTSAPRGGKEMESIPVQAALAFNDPNDIWS